MNTLENISVEVERVDDIPVIYGMLRGMGVQEAIDKIIRPHGNWQGLSPGWLILLWLVHILSEQNHLMEPVQLWASRHLVTLERLTDEPVRELDFTDDRLAMCLRELSKKGVWSQLECELGQRMLRVYDLETDRIRLDATVGKVHHEPENSNLFRLGKAKNNQYETQFKLMVSSLDPLGLPLVSDVEAGNRADDPLYIPSYHRSKAILDKDGILVVGDSKMSSLETRGTIAKNGDYYLTPLAHKKDASDLLSKLLREWIDQGVEWNELYLPDELPEDGSGSEPDPELSIGYGFEVERSQTFKTEEEDKPFEWTERLVVVRSHSYTKSIQAGLTRRLAKAESAFNGLIPPPKSKKKQPQDEKELLTAIKAVEKKYDVQGLFNCTHQKHVEERHIRKYKERKARVETKVRFQLQVERNADAITQAEFEAGWRIYSTNTPTTKLSMDDTVLTYRDQIIVENIFRRLHGKMLSITPLYVQRDDHALGLIHLLTIASRFLALGDHLSQQALAQDEQELAGIYAGNPNRSTPRPTTERMLKAFEGINLLLLEDQDGHKFTILNGFTPLHERILQLLKLDVTLDIEYLFFYLFLFSPLLYNKQYFDNLITHI